MNHEPNPTTPEQKSSDSVRQPPKEETSPSPVAGLESANSQDAPAGDSTPGDSDPAAASRAQGSTAPQTAVGKTDAKATRFAWTIRLGVQAATVVAAGGLLLLLLGIAQRTEWITAAGFSGGVSEAPQPATAGGEEKRYICPMMCTPPSNEPGRCPVCGMELVEATGGGGGDGISVTIESSARRLVGIQTAISKMGDVTRTIRTIGSIDYDESKLSTISAYIDGRLEKLYANYLGIRVSEGDDLALIYSPKLYSAQAEFLSSLERKPLGRFDIDNGSLASMARENLSELGMTDDQIETLRQSGQADSRIRIKSPQSGTVIEKAAVEGDYVKTGQKLFRVADLSSVWLMLDLFPDDAATVRFGQQVEAEIESLPGQVFTGRVAFIDPTVNPKTRTVRVRVEMMNLDGQLKPGDYATARITVPAVPTDLVYDPALSGKYISPMHPQVIRDEPGTCPLCGMDLIPTAQFGYAVEPQSEQRVVTVPRDSVLLTGDNSVIYVETEPGRFEIRRVTVGPMNNEQAVILEGLAAGETVATQGNFLIDSQMQLAGNPSLLDPGRAPSFSPGPLELPSSVPVLLAGETAKHFDAAYRAYFEMQRALAADKAPPPTAVNALAANLAKLEMAGDVPDKAQTHLATARRGAERLDGSLEKAREAFRGVSHAMLRAAIFARGTETAQQLTHYYCPMVPGGGGDWMQPGGELTNPYWGSEMLRCGEVVRELAVGNAAAATVASAAK